MRYRVMRHSFRLKMGHFLSGIVLLLILFSGQSSKLFGISRGILFQILFFSKNIAAVLLFMYALSVAQKNMKFEVRRFVNIFLPLFLLMLLVEFIAVFTSPVPGMYGIRYWTRSLYMFIDRFSILIVIASIWMLCAEEAVDCLAKVFLIDELLIFVSAIFRVGFYGILQNIINAFSFRGFTSNYFEVHELTFSIGLCIIYYLFFDRRKKNKARIALLIGCFILGAKRIGFAGILAAGLFALFIHKKGLTRRKLVLTGIAGIAICVFYLFIIYNEKFVLILNQYNINNMGRSLIYAYFTKRTEFSPFHMGWGMAGVAKVVENMNRNEVLYMAGVRGIHNDILKVYVNFGFIGSLIWYALSLIYFPVEFLKKYGKRPATIYMALAVYMFITYLTDNTEDYFTCQVAFFLIPITEYLVDKKVQGNLGGGENHA